MGRLIDEVDAGDHPGVRTRDSAQRQLTMSPDANSAAGTFFQTPSRRAEAIRAGRDFGHGADDEPLVVR